MVKFKNKYRTESIRLKRYDYSLEGIYFITLCTKKRYHYFGKVSKGEMILTEAGRILKREWLLTPVKRDRIILGEWVVMPNHFHALVGLKPKDKTGTDASHASRAMKGDGCDASQQEKTQIPNQNYQNSFGPQRDNLSSIVRGFKSAGTRQIHEAGIKNFNWQRGFYDHIVRNQKSLIRIEEYIRENPYLWNKDRFNSQQ